MQEHIIDKILRFSQRHSLLMIVLTILVTLFFSFFMLKVKINSDIERSMSFVAAVVAVSALTRMCVRFICVPP